MADEKKQKAQQGGQGKPQGKKAKAEKVEAGEHGAAWKAGASEGDQSRRPRACATATTKRFSRR